MVRKHFILLLLQTAVILSFVSFFGFLYYTYFYVQSSQPQNLVKVKEHKDNSAILNVTTKSINIRDEINFDKKFYNLLPKNVTSSQHSSISKKDDGPHLNSNVHIFYYPWYKNEEIDGKYAHWNHKILPHWSRKEKSVVEQHIPPDDIGANFYPALGPYSSSDSKVLLAHMKQIRYTGVGVVAVSWYPPNLEPKDEEQMDNIMMKILDAAERFNLKVTFHIEPFKNRTGKEMFNVIKYIVDTYGDHKAFYRTFHKGKLLPFYYIYDSYQISTLEWSKALTLQGQYSLRNTSYDGIFVGLLARQEHMTHLSASGFDGCYTYFAIDGFEYGSTWQNWPTIAKDAKEAQLFFVPSIGPGYVDTRIRPWNSKNTKKRLKGQYYRASFLAAMKVKSNFLSITSFNEWHEGTQIEPAVPKIVGSYKYDDYLPSDPEFYLKLTEFFVKEFTSLKI